MWALGESSWRHRWTRPATALRVGVTLRDARVEKGHGQQRQNWEQDLEPGEGPGPLPAECLCYISCWLRAARPWG